MASGRDWARTVSELSAELSAEPDDEVLETRIKPWWRLRRFEDSSVEKLYISWHHALWMPRFQVMLCLSCLLYWCFFILQVLAADSTGGSFKVNLMALRPAFRDWELGTTLAARVVLLLNTLFVQLPCTRRLLTPDRYQRFVFISYLVPALLEQLYGTIGPRNVFATQPDLSDGVDPLAPQPIEIRDSVRSTFFHVTLCDFYFVCIVGLSGLSPEVSANFSVH